MEDLNYTMKSVSRKNISNFSLLMSLKNSFSADDSIYLYM